MRVVRLVPQFLFKEEENYGRGGFLEVLRRQVNSCLRKTLRNQR